MTAQEVTENQNALVLFRGGLYILCGRRTVTVPRKGTWVQLLLRDERVKHSYVVARMEEVETIRADNSP